jgi:hypothetical protein
LILYLSLFYFEGDNLGIGEVRVLVLLLRRACLDFVEFDALRKDITTIIIVEGLVLTTF